MGFFSLSDYNLDDLELRCTIIRLQAPDSTALNDVEYLVLRGDMIEAVDQVLVVQAQEQYGFCYYCAYETSGRLVIGTAGGGVGDIQVCCRHCYNIGRTYNGFGGLRQVRRLCMATRHRRDGSNTDRLARRVKYDAAYRAQLFPRLIDRARALPEWSAQPAPTPQPAQSSPPPEPIKLIDEIDQLLAENARLRGSRLL